MEKNRSSCHLEEISMEVSGLANRETGKQQTGDPKSHRRAERTPRSDRSNEPGVLSSSRIVPIKD